MKVTNLHFLGPRCPEEILEKTWRIFFTFPCPDLENFCFSSSSQTYVNSVPELHRFLRLLFKRPGLCSAASAPGSRPTSPSKAALSEHFSYRTFLWNFTDDVVSIFSDSFHFFDYRT